MLTATSLNSNYTVFRGNKYHNYVFRAKNEKIKTARQGLALTMEPFNVSHINWRGVDELSARFRFGHVHRRIDLIFFFFECCTSYLSVRLFGFRNCSIINGFLHIVRACPICLIIAHSCRWRYHTRTTMPETFKPCFALYAENFKYVLPIVLKKISIRSEHHISDDLSFYLS